MTGILVTTDALQTKRGYIYTFHMYITTNQQQKGDSYSILYSLL